MNEPKLSVLFKFTPSGYLKAIILFAEDDGGQAVLEKALARLFKNQHFGWIKRLLFRKGNS